MKEKLSESNDPQATADPKARQKPEKKQYSAPSMTNLGRVTDLTKGEGSVSDDATTLEGHIPP